MPKAVLGADQLQDVKAAQFWQLEVKEDQVRKVLRVSLIQLLPSLVSIAGNENFGRDIACSEGPKGKFLILRVVFNHQNALDFQ